jgi:hypothetical protein
MTTLIPLYAHPLADPAAWAAVAAAGRTVTAIINVHDGPGRHPDAAYAEATAALRAASVPMLGYVDLNYTRRTEAEVAADIAAWRRYPVDGIFFDQVPTAASSVGAVTRAAGLTVGFIALNPGTRPDRAYAALADLICTFEGPWPVYQGQPDEPDWPNAAHLVYGVPTAELARAGAVLATRTGGAGLVTDVAAPLPYSGVPSWLLPDGVTR